MKSEPIIFLDFDGVICTTRSHFAYSSTLLHRHLDVVAVKMIERLVENSKAKIVISSTWRNHFDQEAINFMLCNAGMREVPFHTCWKTPRLSHRDGSAMSPGSSIFRGDEIAAFLKDHACENYVILDDDSDFHEDQKARHVHTHEHNGFLYEHFEQAHKILGVKVK